MEYILGIDIGTGSTKAVAVGMDHIAFDSSQYFYPTVTAKPQYSEQDPELIWHAFQQSIEELVLKLGHPPLAVGLSTAMHSLIAVDTQCNALAPMMTWADSRSTAVAEQLLASPLGMELYRETGTPVHSMSPLTKIIWIRENQPEFFSTVYKFISIKEYIWFRLFQTFEVDHSIASCSGLMDVEKLVWSERALAAAGISVAQLSVLVPTTYLRTEPDASACLAFLQPGTPFVIGASDGCLANLGTGAVAPGIAALTIGTSGALRMANHQAIFNTRAMTFSYRLDEEIFINGGPVNNGGVALKWHLKNLFQKEQLSPDDYTVALARMEEVQPGAEGLIFLPYLQGERAPIWDSKSCGNFFGMRLTHQPQHFTRAVIEGICFALNDVLQSLEESGQHISQLNVSGGFVSSPAWLQIMADITGKRLVLATTEDASAVGAAYLAVKATGRSAVFPSPVQNESTVVEPNKVYHLAYRKYFTIYKKLYTSLKEVMQEMYELQNSAQSNFP
ncbi:gluconate kinase, FGGY family [Pedobacter westerhofensis]|uniref:Gluconate kinase, FGGY family n=1 Tax=Pedobacter westerhofensis TaxID=425512 RepID=A0A521CLU8_9SPHI|nr:gluconokinase [Pedobacter westerhofensis]SMO59731.1 gluconate kinase, FGGY family [Pedobacter westerhofensis]